MDDLDPCFRRDFPFEERSIYFSVREQDLSSFGSHVDDEIVRDKIVGADKGGSNRRNIVDLQDRQNQADMT